MHAIVLLLACLAFPATAAAPKASIELLARASVATPGVVLGDVARIHASELGLMRTLVNLPIGRAPRSGEAALLQRADLVQWVRRQLGIMPDGVAWSGAEEARVLRAAPQLKGEDIARAALDAARARLRAEGQQLDIEARSLPRDLDVPEGKLRLEVRGLEGGPWPRRLVVWVDVWAERRFVRTGPVSLQLAADGATPPDTPQAGDGLLQRTGPFARAPEGERNPAAVSRGEWAILHSVEGGVTLESRVEVLQGGRPGQRIRVRAQGASGPLFARVLGPGRLELSP